MGSLSRHRSGGRKRSKSGCCRLTPAVYCKATKRHRRRRSRRRRTRSRRSRRRSVRRRRRRGRSRKKRGRCGKRGPKTTNPFLNFMRLFRRKKCGWPVAKIAIEGAKCWCRLKKADKMRFYREACIERKKRRRSRRRSRRRKSKRRRRRRSRRSKRRKKKSSCL